MHAGFALIEKAWIETGKKAIVPAIYAGIMIVA